jgi:hypothetical protein
LASTVLLELSILLDDYVKEQHKASLLEDSKIVDTETEDDSKRHQ